MNNQSTKRRMAGRGLLAAALVALPLTATVTYAESNNFEEAFADVPAPPAPPAPPATSVAVPAPPAPPAPPAAVFAVQAAPEVSEDEEVWVDEEGNTRVIVKREVSQDVERTENGKTVSRTKVIRVENDGEPLSKEEMREIIMEVREGLEDADEAIKEAYESQRMAFKSMDDAKGQFTTIEVNCESGGKGQKLSQNGEEITVICESDIMASALAGLKEARKALSTNPEMPKDMLEEVLKALDEKIAEWEDRTEG